MTAPRDIGPQPAVAAQLDEALVLCERAIGALQRNVVRLQNVERAITLEDRHKTLIRLVRAVAAQLKAAGNLEAEHAAIGLPGHVSVKDNAAAVARFLADEGRLLEEAAKKAEEAVSP